jgi:hypothetical protein
MGILPDDLYIEFEPWPRIGRPPKQDVDTWAVTDDWPERVPITDAELDVFEAWFGDFFDGYSANDRAVARCAFLRASTARQAEHDVSIPDQKRQGEAYCASRSSQFVETYVEPGAGPPMAGAPSSSGLGLAVDGIAGDQHAGEIEQAKQCAGRGDLVAAVRNGNLAQHQPRLAGERSDDRQR